MQDEVVRQVHREHEPWSSPTFADADADADADDVECKPVQEPERFL